jgi:hypothetical protein
MCEWFWRESLGDGGTLTAFSGGCLRSGENEGEKRAGEKWVRPKKDFADAKERLVGDGPGVAV